MSKDEDGQDGYDNALKYEWEFIKLCDLFSRGSFSDCCCSENEETGCVKGGTIEECTGSPADEGYVDDAGVYEEENDDENDDAMGEARGTGIMCCGSGKMFKLSGCLECFLR